MSTGSPSRLAPMADHAETARRLLETPRIGAGAAAAATLQRAQVHATLALVDAINALAAHDN